MWLTNVSKSLQERNAQKGGMNELYNKRSYARVGLDTALELFRVCDPPSRVSSKQQVGSR